MYFCCLWAPVHLQPEQTGRSRSVNIISLFNQVNVSSRRLLSRTEIWRLLYCVFNTAAQCGSDDKGTKLSAGRGCRESSTRPSPDVWPGIWLDASSTLRHLHSLCHCRLLQTSCTKSMLQTEDGRCFVARKHFVLFAFCFCLGFWGFFLLFLPKVCRRSCHSGGWVAIGLFCWRPAGRNGQGQVEVKWMWAGVAAVVWSSLLLKPAVLCCRLGGGLSFLHLLSSWNTFQSIKMQIGPLIERCRSCCVCKGK